MKEKSKEHRLTAIAGLTVTLSWTVLVFIMTATVLISNPGLADFSAIKFDFWSDNSMWSPPDSTQIPKSNDGELITYGHELIAHTAVYLGPSGTVKPLSNGMNCQNCHTRSGKTPFGYNFSAVASTYPKFRERSGKVESIEKRVNDCMERSLNGQPLDSLSREMRAFVAYLKWIGKDVPKGETPAGSGVPELKFLTRAADPAKGKTTYNHQCVRCHGPNGEGKMTENGNEWKYPPLFGANSFNTGAGLLRLSRMAGFIKANMPNDVSTYDKPHLTDEEAWDVAAYISSMPRPMKDLSGDWPSIATKPFDYPFGPYADAFAEGQHKYGPFEPVKQASKK